MTQQSDALDLERRVFTKPSARAIALSLKRSAERSRRRKSNAYRSSMSMLTFYVNRAGRNLPASTRRKLQGANIYLDFQSAGATQHLMTAACLAEGTTVIENCAAEPEVVDLANFLNALGARILGAGTPTITIDGVVSLHGGEYSVISDRMECSIGSFKVRSSASVGPERAVFVASSSPQSTAPRVPIAREKSSVTPPRMSHRFQPGHCQWFGMEVHPNSFHFQRIAQSAWP